MLSASYIVEVLIPIMYPENRTRGTEAAEQCEEICFHIKYCYNDPNDAGKARAKAYYSMVYRLFRYAAIHSMFISLLLTLDYRQSFANLKHVYYIFIIFIFYWTALLSKPITINFRVTLCGRS